MSRERRVLVVIGTVAVLGCSLGLAAWRSKTGLWSLTTGLLALPTLVISLITWWERPRAAAAGDPAELLAGLVGEQCQAEIRTRRLEDPAPLGTCWRLTELDVMDHLSQVVPRPTGLARPRRDRAGEFGRTDRMAELARRFRELSRQRLVILGEPGIGKTTLAMLLARELLRSRACGDPVPVVFTVSGWDPARQPLADWFADRLAEAYPALRAPELGRGSPERLVTTGRVLPVIDGLDEVPAESRGAILQALSLELATGPAVVTCRTGDYVGMVESAHGQVLRGAAVIEPRHVSADQVIAHLTACLPPNPRPCWTAFLAVLVADPDGPPARALSVPLTLWLLRVVYVETGRDPSELCDIHRFDSDDAITAHLLGHLVEAHAQAATPRDRGPGDAERSLAFLARHLSAQGTRDLAWWRLPLAVPRRWFKAGAGLLLGLLVGAIDGLLNLAVAPPDRALTSGLLNGFLFAVLIALFIEPARPPRRSPKAVTIVKSLAKGAAAGASLGLLTGLVLAATRSLPYGTGEAALAGVYHGLNIGMMCGLQPLLVHTFPDLPCGPDLRVRGRRRLLIRDLRTGLAQGVPCGAALTTGFLPWHLYHHPAGRAILIAATGGLLSGIVIGAGIGLARWLTTPPADAPAQTPPASLRCDLRLALMLIVAIALPLPPVVALLTHGSAMVIPAMFLAILITTRPSTHYLVAVTVLCVRRQLPCRLMRLLRHSHQNGLLRQLGPVYQFRHASLQDRLAAPPLPVPDQDAGDQRDRPDTTRGPVSPAR